MSVPLGTTLNQLAAVVPDRPRLTCGQEALTRSQVERQANRLEVVDDTGE